MKDINFIQHLALKYKLKILYFDFSLIARIGLSSEVFIQIYINTRKEKINLALVVFDDRVYGIDKDFYHEHPFKNPKLHIPTDHIENKGLYNKSLEYLRNWDFFRDNYRRLYNERDSRGCKKRN
ncbi:MAG: hypothetical protein ACPLZA_07045 [Thermodesulfovibrio sp.]|uniref:hypothetical protein n=2 Tax=Thermodesulfovibrio sp. TaxID=2067987 RepID=UPI003CA2D94A